MAIPPTITALIDGVIGREGGYSDHPADKGGPTRWGVTEKVARANGYRGDMRVFPRDLAFAIYKLLYWDRPRLGMVAQRYPAVAAEMFDTGVNMGVGVAAEFLQRALNALNSEGAHYRDVVLDGDIGLATLDALDGFRKRRGDEGGERLLEAIRSLRGARYIEICELRPANEAFTYGWFSRMVEMAKAIFR
ncbi:glycoside hydrolase family 108 protein [Sphingomonas sp.]|jgi:lysozyme family protein|uniref:glycoside hydrolase family 108 protein n=1 Tax=Sphingomonas sp. TaxID=28214 RepID=UPI002ED841C6